MARAPCARLRSRRATASQQEIQGRDLKMRVKGDRPGKVNRTDCPPIVPICWGAVPAMQRQCKGIVNAMSTGGQSTRPRGQSGDNFPARVVPLLKSLRKSRGQFLRSGIEIVPYSVSSI